MKSTKDIQNVDNGNGTSKTALLQQCLNLIYFFRFQCYKDIMSSQGQSEFKMRRQLNPCFSSLPSVEIFTVFLQHIHALFSWHFRDVSAIKSSIKSTECHFFSTWQWPHHGHFTTPRRTLFFPPYWCVCSTRSNTS